MWILSENLLCDRVDFFRAAFKGPFAEANHKEMIFTEDHVGAFAKFIDWVYTGKVECKECAEAKEDATESFRAEHEVMWCSLWVLADYLGAVALEKLSLAKIKECFGARRAKFGGKYIISAEAVKYVYENTGGKKSPLRALILNEITRFWFSIIDQDERTFKLAQITGGNSVVLLELLEAVNKHTSHKDCWQKKYCYFHGGKCLVCKEEVELSRRQKNLAKVTATEGFAAAEALEREQARQSALRARASAERARLSAALAGRSVDIPAAYVSADDW